MPRSQHELETGPLETADLAVNLDGGSAAPDDESLDFTVDSLHALTVPEPPKLISDRYDIVRLIQSGGMGLVYQAHDRMLDRDVALKVLRADRVTPLALDDFAKEAQVMAFLPHPGVPPIYETGTCESGQPFHVMKLVDGVTLRRMLDEGRVETAELLRIFTDVCQTMAFAHSRGLLHLDLKPDNIMVGAFGEINVMDWGLAQHYHHADPIIVLSQSKEAGGQTSEADMTMPQSEEADAGELITRQAQVNGTPEYMSPEQARGSTLDARADVFSLGGILCEILSGHAPYEGTNLRQVYRSAVQGKTHASIERLQNCGLDDALVRLAINCLQVEVAARPPDAKVLSQVMMAHQTATLRSVQSDMDRFFELSPDMFCIADKHGYFVRINDNFCKVLGYSKDALLSKPFLSFVHQEDQQRTMEQVAILDEGRSVVRFRNRYITVKGDYVTIEWTAKAIEDEHLIFAVARDVTERVD